MAFEFFLKLRRNIALEGDVSLAEREAQALFGEVRTVAAAADVHKYFPISAELAARNARPSPPIGFVARSAKYDARALVRYTSFIQEIWFDPEGQPEFASAPPWSYRVRDRDRDLLCYVPLLTAAELLSYNGTLQPGVKEVQSVARFLATGESRNPARATAAVSRSMTSTAHVHGLHKYKAKFFPRMIRSFILRSLDNVPRQSNGDIVLLDPFLGSGTALVEALMLGMSGVGIDIDRLSCYISSAKLDLLLQDDPQVLSQVVSRLKTEHWGLFQVARDEERYKFPPWIAQKFEKWHARSEQSKLESEIGDWVSAIKTVEPSPLRRILEVSLSDAISRKFNIRMMGTGVGRFALEIADSDLSSFMASNLDNLVRMAFTSSAIRSAYGVATTQMRIINDTATSMPLPDGSISLILTSPPYLPASSGRENYLIGKSISITALGIMTSEEIADTENRSVGSMKFNGNVDFTELPKEVGQLYNWLKSDPLRNIKADPTVLYYKSLRQALGESCRVLQPGGLAIYVIGRESVFYQFSTRRVLYRVACDKIFQSMAERCGFKVEDVVDVELDKKNKNARPRGLDSYYESAIFLRKPS